MSPMSELMDEKLKRRKLDALKRGIHRVSSTGTLAVSTHVVGIGRAGAGVIAEILRGLAPDAPKFFGLAIDIGVQDLADLRALTADLPVDRAEVAIIALDVPERAALLSALQKYPEFLTLEYPSFYWAAGYEPWLTPSVELPKAGQHFGRAVAKAIYGLAYYDAPRRLERVLRDFAEGVEAATVQSVVAIVFGLGGGTGSGIAVDLARHLSNKLFGRRILVAGVGIAPCTGDTPDHAGGHLYPVLNELDCLNDEGKNRGVVASCGELFRNPFTAGFIVVPQQQAWESTQDLAETQQRGNREVATLLSSRGGTNFLETLRLLNWVAAPSTQHSAARTPYGAKWVHMFGFADADGSAIAVGPDLVRQLGLLPSYQPEFVEARVASAPGADKWASRLQDVFGPDAPPQVVDGGRAGSVQFILPSISKTDLALFYEARAAYDGEDPSQRLLDHSLLLDQGVLLSEPSTRLEGMAGAGIRGGESWVAIPFADLRGGELAPLHAAAFKRELHGLGQAL